MSQPNFVFIMTDTQAANVIGAYGHPGVRTTCLDRLAERGVTFERAYTTCPLCTPARAGIFTGIYPHTAGAWTNNLPLGKNIKTMGERFADAGYDTGYIGKWHLDGHDYFGTGRCPEGWDEDFWYDGARYLSGLSDEEIRLWRGGLNSVDDLREHDIRPEFTWAHRISDRGIEFLRQQDDQPFLLVASYDEPHHPFTCPPDYAEAFLDYCHPLGSAVHDDLSDKPAHQREWAASESAELDDGCRRHPMYFGCNRFVDHEIGRLIDAVHELAPDNTVIVFTSDHGDMLGAHQLTGKGPAMYEEITHIPLIVEMPGQAMAGVRKGTLVSHIDLLPTMLELAELEVPPIMEGESLVPLLEGGEEPERSVVVEFHRYEIEHDSWGGFQPIRAIVGEGCKLVVNLLHSDELYDLERDPGEVVNRIDDPDSIEVRDRLHRKLLDWMYEKRDPFRGPVWERRSWQESRRLQWKGAFRPRPADGYAPPVRDYDTGFPTKGVHVEFEDADE